MDNKQAMTDEEREIANKYQLQVFLSGLHSPWRLFSIKGIRKIFENYDAFYLDIIETPFVLSENKTQVKYGLTYSAISETIQYIEDLFSIISTSKNIDTLIKDVVNYNASDIKKYILTFETMSDEKKLSEMLIPYLPDNEVWEQLDIQKVYVEGKANILAYLEKIIGFYKKYYPFYLQYKHGLKTPLNPYGNQEQHDIISTEIPLCRYENRSIKDTGKALVIPSIHPSFSPFVSQLYKEKNLLRYEIGMVNFDEIEEIAYFTFQLVSCVHTNLTLLAQAKNEQKIIEKYFPNDDKEIPFFVIGFPIE